MQGFNMGRYRPPEALDNALSLAAPRSSQRLSQPRVPPEVRFEVPFAIWCKTCPVSSNDRLIGQGRRFNARKKQVGHYYSTKIYSFRFKHTTCGGWIELRTDPQTSNFVVSEGATARDYGDGVTPELQPGEMLLQGTHPGDEATKAAQEQQKREDAFLAFEGKAARKVTERQASDRIDELRSLRARDWQDPDAAGRKVREIFRPGRRAREQDRTNKVRTTEQMGLGIELLDASEEDAKHAELVEFGNEEEEAARKVRARPFIGSQERKRQQIEAPVLHTMEAKRRYMHQTKLEALQSELKGNTRASMDPFALDRKRPVSGDALLGIKRKRKADNVSEKNSIIQAPEVVEGQTSVNNDRRASSEHRQDESGHSLITRSLAAYDSD